MTGETTTRCALCHRRVPRTQRHHLIPRTRHSNKRTQKAFEREEMTGRLVNLCPPCHKTVHATFTTKELEREYNTLAAIAEHPDIRKFVAWVRKQPAEADVRVRRGGKSAEKADRQQPRRSGRRGR